MRGKNLLGAIFVAGALVVLLNTIAVNARPVDPTEGEWDNEQTRTEWNWGLRAYVWGYWVWFWMYRPPILVFTDLYHEGSRWGGLGVWYIDVLTIQCVSEHYNHYAFTDGSAVGVYHSENRYDYGKTKAWSWFQNWIGERWPAETPWAIISFV